MRAVSVSAGGCEPNAVAPLSATRGRRAAGADRGRVLRGCTVIAAAAVAIAALLSSTATSAFEDFDDYGVYTLVLLRHGESEWNLQNKFTGWVDVDVTEKGAAEAQNAGRLMAEANLTFDVAFTSVQKRAIKTLNMALEEMDLLYLPVEKSWRLNERMYGDLQGLNKAETQQKFGEEQVTAWRRSFDIPPPPIEDDSPYHPKLDKRFDSVPKRELPLTESLQLTIRRVLPFWKSTVVPALKARKKVLIAAHGNSLRSLVKYLDNVPNDKIVGLNIPTAVPLVYKLNRRMKPIVLPNHAEDISGVYLGDPEWVNSKIHGVANQAASKR